MANTPQSIKRVKQAEKRREQNASYKSMVRTYIKKVIKAIEEGDKELAQQTFKEASQVLDKVAGKGIIHKNKAARNKSRLNAKVKKLNLGDSVIPVVQ